MVALIPETRDIVYLAEDVELYINISNLRPELKVVADTVSVLNYKS